MLLPELGPRLARAGAISPSPLLSAPDQRGQPPGARPCSASSAGWPAAAPCFSPSTTSTGPTRAPARSSRRSSGSASRCRSASWSPTTRTSWSAATRWAPWRRCWRTATWSRRWSSSRCSATRSSPSSRRRPASGPRRASSPRWSSAPRATRSSPSSSWPPGAACPRCAFPIRSRRSSRRVSRSSAAPRCAACGSWPRCDDHSRCDALLRLDSGEGRLSGGGLDEALESGLAIEHRDGVMIAQTVYAGGAGVGAGPGAATDGPRGPRGVAATARRRRSPGTGSGRCCSRRRATRTWRPGSRPSCSTRAGRPWSTTCGRSSWTATTAARARRRWGSGRG